ncbi:MAG: methylase domain protein [Planctomycetaceae bacterium]|nr:methylase domain protein [Planctomycetaceae bacterium]
MGGRGSCRAASVARPSPDLAARRGTLWVPRPPIYRIISALLGNWPQCCQNADSTADGRIVSDPVGLKSLSKRKKSPLAAPQNPINTILNVDCVAALAVLQAESVDLVFADPPFNIGYDYDVYDDAQDQDTYLNWSEQWIAGVHRALKPDGTFWLAIGDEYAAELKVMSRKIGFTCRSWVIWYYTFGVNCKKKFSRSHAHLFHFVKDPQNFTFNDEAIRVPSARQLVYNDKRANSKGRLPDDTWILRPQDLPAGFQPTDDTWYFPRVAGTFKERAGFHGCQMPEQLLGRIIRSCSNEGELVLDPFSGSATTLVVAKKLGREFLGFDLSEEYVERGRSRLEKVKPGSKLEGAAEPLVSAPATPPSVESMVPASVRTRRKKTVAAEPTLPFGLDEAVQAR